MRRILELLSSLLSINPDGKTSDPVKLSMLQRLLSIITHQSAQPLVKPAFKSLEYFLGKGAISTGALIDCYEDQTSSNESDPGIRNGTSSSWDSLMTAIFEWLAVPDVSPAAGKLLVTLFIRLRDESAALYSQNADHTVLWQRWIRNGLHKNPDILENVKNYLFPALFKLDRTGSLLFLHDLNNQGSISNLQVQDSSAHFLLQLAALEVGKKLGLVEDPGMCLITLNSQWGSNFRRRWPTSYWLEEFNKACSSWGSSDWRSVESCVRHCEISCIFCHCVLRVPHSTIQCTGLEHTAHSHRSAFCWHRRKISQRSLEQFTTYDWEAQRGDSLSNPGTWSEHLPVQPGLFRKASPTERNFKSLGPHQRAFGSAWEIRPMVYWVLVRRNDSDGILSTPYYSIESYHLATSLWDSWDWVGSAFS